MKLLTPNPPRKPLPLLAAASVICALLLAGCNTGPGGGDGWQFKGPDADQPDTGPTPDTSIDTSDTTSGPIAHTFKIVNTGEVPVDYFRKSTCNPDANEWLNLGFEDATVKLNKTCDVCACNNVDQCADCPASGACRPPTTRTLQPGESHQIEWDGEAWIPDQVGSTACHRPHVPAVGTEMDAIFSWYRTGGDPDADKKGRVIPFTYGEQTDITARISLAPEPSPATIRLKNESSRTIWIQEGSECTGPTPLWMNMLKQDGRRARAGLVCGQCECSTIRNNPDDCYRTCPAACIPPQWQELTDGHSVRWRWPGYLYNESSVDGESCQKKQVPELGETFQVEFCWATDSSGNQRRCDTRRFNYGVTSAVEHAVK